MVVLGVFLEDILGGRDGLVPFLLLDRFVDGLEQGLGARHGSLSPIRVEGRLEGMLRSDLVPIRRVVLSVSVSQNLDPVC